MDTAIWIPIVLTVIVIVAIFFFLNGSVTPIVADVNDGRKSVNERVTPSSGQPGGIEFSYTGWLRIDDFTYRYGTERIVFVKGTPDLTAACPALVIDANTNTLLVKMDTFGSQEILPVTSVPANKWLHFAIVATQEKLEVYVNGIIYAHRNLTHLPRQNSGSVITSPDGGFKGEVSKIEYHPRALTAGDIAGLSSKQPPVSESGQIFPPYFSSKWYAQTH